MYSRSFRTAKIIKNDIKLGTAPYIVIKIEPSLVIFQFIAPTKVKIISVYKTLSDLFPKKKNGRIKHSIVAWCFQDYWSPDELIPIAREMGCVSVELMDPKYYADLKEHGMQCAIAGIDIGGPPFMQGFNNPKYHEMVIAATKKSIDECKEYGWKKVIAFTGYDEGLTKAEGAENCVKGFKEVVGYAEDAGVTICLEHLNTRDDTHPMKGHPGYAGDDVEYCIDILERVDSPNLKLLFDIYHVSIMNGDVIRRIHQHKDWLGHIHTAGNPGRAELDDNQEIN